MKPLKTLLYLNSNRQESTQFQEDLGEYYNILHFESLETIPSAFGEIKNKVDLCICVLHESIIEYTGFLNQVREKFSKQVLPIIFIYPDYLGESSLLEHIPEGVNDILSDSLHNALLKLRIDSLLKIQRQKQAQKAIEQLQNKKHVSPYKRAFDIVASGGALLLLSPLLLMVAILIRLESKGSPFYTSQRAGSNYKIFPLIKFRTMYQDADKQLEKLKHLNQYQATEDQEVDEKGAVFMKLAKDPRITRIGGFLRKTSIDELPQLINVLRGDMSLVGNRPLPLYEAEQLTRDNTVQRFDAPAGITGLWQVTKRGKANMSTEERIALDNQYAEDHSFMMDMKIILKTFPALLQSEKV